MTERMRAWVAGARTGLRAWGEALRTHRFWTECAMVTLLGLAAAYSLGSAALTRAAELERRTAHLLEVQRGLATWRAELQPPTPQESLAWRRSEELLLSLGSGDAEPLVLARLVAQRAEEVGVEDLRIRLAHEDSLSPGVAVQVGEWALDSGTGGLNVEFTGGMAEVIGFLGALPPQAQVRGIELRRAPDGLLRARTVVASRRVIRRG